MGDMGYIYRDWKELKKEKKRTDCERIMNLLKINHISFDKKNDGSHLIVWIDNQRIDVWPTTNKAKIGIKYKYNAYQFLLSKILKRNYAS